MFTQAGGTNTHPNQCLTRTVKDKLLNGNGFFYTNKQHIVYICFPSSQLNLRKMNSNFANYPGTLPDL